MNCSGNEGGGIYSNYEGASATIVVSCSFHNCVAEGTSGRGAAVQVLNGNAIFQNCCVDYSESQFGGDIQTNGFDVQIVRFINIQTFSGKFQYHPTFLRGKDVQVKYSNSTKNEISENNNYGNVLSFSTIETLTAQYINGFQCSGGKSFFSFEDCKTVKTDFKMSHINAIDNKNAFIIAFSNSQNINLLLEECNFLGTIEYNYKMEFTSNNNHITYIKCGFSINNDSINEESISFESCFFKQTLHSILIFDECYQKPIKTHEINIQKPKYIYFHVFIFIYIK